MLESIWELFKLFCGIVAALFFGIVLAFFALFAVLIGAAFAVRDYFLAANEKINLREWDWEEDDEPARRSYFFGPGYAQLVSTFNQSFENNRKTVEWFKDVTEEHVYWIDWDDYKKKTATKLSQSWQAYYNTSLLPIEYLSNKNMLMVFPGDNIAMPDYSPELVAIKEKCRQIIIDYSWKMVFAKDDEKFESYFKDMVKMVKSIGFDKVFEEDYARSRSIIDKH